MYIVESTNLKTGATYEGLQFTDFALAVRWMLRKKAADQFGNWDFNIKTAAK